MAVGHGVYRVPNTRWMHWSLLAVWWGTALVSLIEYHGESQEILYQAGLSDVRLIQGLILGGIGLDGSIGILLWRWPGVKSYYCALWGMVLMTLVGSVLQPALWLHPLGPLLKNLPIAAMLIFLIQLERMNVDRKCRGDHE